MRKAPGARRALALVSLGAAVLAVAPSAAVAGEGRAPALAFVSPGVGPLSGGVRWQANASDASGIAKVDFLVDGVLKWTARSGPYVYRGDPAIWDTPTGASGTRVLKLRATDRHANTRTISRTVTLAGIAPGLSLSGPASGSTISVATDLVAWPSHPAGIARVEFYVDGVLEETDTGPYAYTLDPSRLVAGRRVVRVVARSKVGTTTSARHGYVLASASAPKSLQRSDPSLDPAPLPAPLPAPPPSAPLSNDFFNPSDWWNTSVSGAPTDGSSPSAMSSAVARIVRQSRYGDRNMGINTTSWGYAVYTIPPGYTNLKKVTLVSADGGSAQPSGSAYNLQSKWMNVPIPTGIGQLQPDGRDGYVVVYRPETGEVWDFWRFANRPGLGWSASYGGYVGNASTYSGIAPNRWGARASGFSLPGGMISLRDLERGVINHGLGFGLYSNCGKTAPATRGDCFGVAADQLPAGTRFRLPDSYDVDANLAGAPKLTRMIAKAAQRYGITLVDHVGASVAFWGEDPRTIGTPFQAARTNLWPSHITGWGQDVLEAFPWSALQQVRYG